MLDYYILDENKNPVPASVEDWARFYENENRCVRRTEIKKYGVVVSTVFLGLDHNIRLPGHSLYEPHIFESMIFWVGNEETNQRMKRYSTWNQAIAGHRKMVRMVIRLLRMKNE